MDEASLGRFITQRRRELGLRQVDLAANAAITQGYLTKLEAGSRYPSTEALTRLARALEVETELLIRLRDAETEGQTFPWSSPDSESCVIGEASRLEVDLLRAVRSMDERGQQLLLETAGVCSSYFGNRGGLPMAQLRLSIREEPRSVAEDPQITASYESIARHLVLIGSRMHDHELHDEALSAFESAIRLGERLNQPIELAEARFLAARVLNGKAHRGQEPIECLQLARHYLALAYDVLIGSRDKLNDELAGRIPELITLWARILRRLADLNSAGLPSVVAGVVTHALLLEAQVRRLEAEQVFQRLIAEFSSRPPSRERDELLAEAYHRHGILQRDTARSAPVLEGEQPDLEAFDAAVESFEQAIVHRQHLVVRAEREGDKEAGNRYRERLGNSTMEFGWVLANSPLNEWLVRALWQYRAAGELHPKYRSEENTHLMGLLDTLRKRADEEDLSAWPRAQSRIEGVLPTCKFEQLEYPLDPFNPNHGQIV